MNTYIISYDLKDGTEVDYENVYEKIKSYNTWANISESTSAIVTDDSAAEIRNAFKIIIPKGSTIFVVKSGGEAAWSKVKCTNEWLKNNL